VETKPNLDDLLDQWEQARDEGRTLTAEILCAESPELLEQLQEQIDKLRQMDQRLNSAHDATQLHGSTRQSPETTDRNAITRERPLLQTAFDGLVFHAQGGLGLVFQGTDLRLHRRVALKFMHKHLAEIPWARERFLLEAEITGRLDHPGIVPVHGVGMTESTRPFYAMRFIRGDTLDVAIAGYHRTSNIDLDSGQRSLDFRALLNRFISVCNTLAYAHNCGIVHRDVKPENIMLGRYAETLVVDWGLALAVDRDEMARQSGEKTIMPSSGSQAGTSSGGPAGTPAYMAPEQARDCDNVDRRADIYSLGVVLYKILCGQIPYSGTNALQILEKLKRGKYARPREVDSTVPPPLEAICLKAMATDPDARYETALELAADLDHWLADEPVTAYRESAGAAWNRWQRRHRTLAMALAGALALLALVASVSAVALGTYARSESTLRDAAEKAQQQSLGTSALLAAETVGREIDRRWELLERAALDPVLAELLNAINAKPTDDEGAQKIRAARQKLQDWLAALGTKSQKLGKFDSLFIVNQTGEQLARQPLDEGLTIGKNFARRDYFHGRGRDYFENETPPRQPIQRPHHCAVYLSTTEHALKIAFSVPIWSDPAGVPERRVLGVLGLSVLLNQFGGVLERKFPGQDVLLVDLRYDTVDKTPQQGLVLHATNLTTGQGQKPTLPRLGTGLIAQLQEHGAGQLWQNQQRARGAEIPPPGAPAASPPNAPTGNGNGIASGVFDSYVDPVGGGPGLELMAAYSEVLIPGRANNDERGGNDANLGTGWIVIVQQRIGGEK